MSLKSNILQAIDKQPCTEKQLKASLNADGKKIAKMLKKLRTEGRIKQEGSLYMPCGLPAGKVPGLVEGSLVKLGRSFGFVAPGDGTSDVFIPGHSLKGAMPGDVVRVLLSRQPSRPGSREGEVVQIITAADRVSGKVVLMEGRLALLPDNAPDTPLFIKKSADGGVQEGELAAAQILERGERHDDIRLGIVQRFGTPDTARQCIKAVLFSANVAKGFSEDVKKEAQAAAAAKIAKDELKARHDLRGEPIFTIDSAATKDIDDAISVSRTKAGYRLGVHIADVSWYVKVRSALDEEANARGTSIYYGDSVIPMLPKALSNGACSLNPEEDRLAFSCEMELDASGVMLDYRFFKSVIQSRVKGVYDEVNALFEEKAPKELQKKYAPVQQQLPVMLELYHKLAALRGQRGSMEIESDEPVLLLDAQGVCTGVEKRSRGTAERMIEEFMLMANTAAAHLARRAEIPFIYRVHDAPAPDRVEGLKTVLTALGLDAHFAGEAPTQKELSALLDETRGTALEIPVHTAVLRSMAKAVYEPLPKGHYGLALQDYAHFTSPIRRYPDLAIHRILADQISGAGHEQLQKRYGGFVQRAAAQSSQREQLAQQIERSCDGCYKAEFMKPLVGQSFDGVITSATSFGIYVGLPNTVEGLVHISHLPQHGLQLVDGMALRDTASGVEYRVGQPMRVRLAGVDIARGHVDFVPEEAPQGGQSKHT